MRKEFNSHRADNMVTELVWDKHHGRRFIVLVLLHILIHSHSTAHRFSSWPRFTDFSGGTRSSLKNEKKKHNNRKINHAVYPNVSF